METIEERRAKKEYKYFEYEATFYTIIGSDIVNHNPKKRRVIEQGIHSYEDAKKKALEYTRKNHELVYIVKEIGTTVDIEE